MFGIGMQEVILILVIALVVIGPKKLPEVAKALGKGYGEFRRAFEDMKSTINVDMRTDDEADRLRRVQEQMKTPGEDTPQPDPAVTPSVTPEVVVPAPEPDTGSGETADGGDVPSPAEPKPIPETGNAPTAAYSHDDEDIEGGGA